MHGIKVAIYCSIVLHFVRLAWNKAHRTKTSTMYFESGSCHEAIAKASKVVSDYLNGIVWVDYRMSIASNEYVSQLLADKIRAELTATIEKQFAVVQNPKKLL